MSIYQVRAVLFAIVAASVTAAPSSIFAVDVRFNAFADVSVGYNWGGAASASDAALQGIAPLDDFPLNVNEGFGIVGTDFVVTADLTDNLVYQAEVNLQVGRGNSFNIEVDFERMYLDYRVNEAVNIQAGLYFTPIGYHNRFLYSRAWLLFSVQVHDLFEEELNLMPTHTVGINVHGTIEPMDQTFKYAIGIGNGRQTTPTGVAYNRAPSTFEGDLEITALLEWHAPIDDTLIVGLSGWTSATKSVVPPGLGMTADITTDPNSSFREYGIIPFVTYFGRDFNVLLEGVWGRIHDRKGNLPQANTDMGGITAEVSLNLVKNSVHPYIRYDRSWLPHHTVDPYYGLRNDGDEYTQLFIPEFNAGMLGVAYDWNFHTRLKAEIIKHFGGPRQEWGIVGQIAFGF